MYSIGMPLKRIFTHRLVRVLRAVLPFALIVFIAIPSWNYWVRRAATAVPPIRVPELPRDLAVRTEGFTFSRTEGGRTAFSVRAKSSLGFKDNRSMLEDVEVTVYGETEQDPERRIRSRRSEYDERSGDIRFYENVEAELDEKTTARTEELIYNHQSRVISSTQPIALDQPGGMTGQANQFEYAISTGILQLKGDVRIRTIEGTLLESGSAVFFENENFATFADGVLLQTQTGWVRGSYGRADLEPETFSPRLIALESAVTAESRSVDGRESWKISTVRLEATISPNGIAQQLRARGAVELRKTGGNADQVLTGEEVDATLDAVGQVQTLDARQNARMLLGGNQTLQAGRISTDAAGRVSTDAESTLRIGDSVIEGRNFTIENGDMVTFTTLYPASLRSGPRRTSADRTEARFNNRTSELVELTQTGNFQFEEGPRSGRSARARIEDGGNIVTFEGSPVILLPEMRLQADRIRINQKEGSFVATTNVRTTRRNSAERVLVTADRAEGTAEGITYTNNVQLWSGATEIKSDRLVASTASNTLHADGKVRSNLGTFRATSDKLDYDDKQGVAHYTGNVRAQRQDVTMETRDMKVKIQDQAVSEIAALGGVAFTQGDRRGTGEQAVYDPRTETITLTGRNASVTDPERGIIRGARLVMNKSSNRVVVESEAGSKVESRHPVK